MPTDCLVHQQPHLETLTPAQSEALCKALRQARAMLLGANERLPEKAAPRFEGEASGHPHGWIKGADEQLAYAQKILHGEAECPTR